MSTQPKTFLTPEQCLEIERAAEFKSEYYNGEMFAMASNAPEHIVIVTNFVLAVGRGIRSHGCEIFPTELRVCTSPKGLYTYPDIAVVCGKPEFLKGPLDTLLNPILLVEVLSNSTEAWDRGRKFENYKRIATLNQYLLIASDRVHLDLYTRQPSGDWLLSSCDSPDDTLELKSVGCRVPVAELYERVELA